LPTGHGRGGGGKRPGRRGKTCKQGGRRPPQGKKTGGGGDFSGGRGGGRVSGILGISLGSQGDKGTCPSGPTSCQFKREYCRERLRPIFRFSHRLPWMGCKDVGDEGGTKKGTEKGKNARGAGGTYNGERQIFFWGLGGVGKFRGAGVGKPLVKSKLCNGLQSRWEQHFAGVKVKKRASCGLKKKQPPKCPLSPNFRQNGGGRPAKNGVPGEPALGTDSQTVLHPVSTPPGLA